VSFVVDLEANGTAAVSPYCVAATPTQTGPEHDVGLNFGAYGQSIGDDIFTVATGTTISLECNGISAAAFSYDDTGSQFISALPLSGTN
jgi:hypothetical protein